jgi:membrane fusion protein, multidrug efflux system
MKSAGRIGISLLAMLALASCDRTPSPGAPPAVEVATMEVKPAPFALEDELPGRVAPLRIAEVRARVAGIVLRRVFTEGAEMRAGETLFEIDPAPFRADQARAKAATEKAQATLLQANNQAERYRRLVDTGAVSRQQYDIAIAAERQARAELSQAEAELQRAELNLGYATVTAPIAGVVGRALVTEGALVGQNEATPMATVQQIDSVYVDFKQPVSQLENLRRAAEAQVRLADERGRPYPHQGKLLFSDITVDPGTGEITLRAVFPNPDRTLLPNMFVRVRLQRGVDAQALAVPQQAVQYDSAGQAQVITVDTAGKTTAVAIKAGPVKDGRQLVLEGLTQGAVVVVEGQGKIMPGATVKPVPWGDKQAVTPATPSAGQ